MCFNVNSAIPQAAGGCRRREGRSMYASQTYPYFTWFSRRMLTSWRLKPHWGAEGVPFMKSMTGLEKKGVSLPCHSYLTSAKTVPPHTVVSSPQFRNGSVYSRSLDQLPQPLIQLPPYPPSRPEYSGAVCGSPSEGLYPLRSPRLTPPFAALAPFVSSLCVCLTCGSAFNAGGTPSTPTPRRRSSPCPRTSPHSPSPYSHHSRLYSRAHLRLLQ